MIDIKDETLVISRELKGNTFEITIKDGKKLGEVFNVLPPGIVIKGETGMGATTLELRSERKSIIVEPLKITASQKAHKEGAIYVGSPSKQFPTKISDKKILSHVSGAGDNVKIIVVADSLKRVRSLLGQSFYDYFLMIDEMDSFQLDSRFRESMSDCIDIYLEHPKAKRALVTATPIDFSHPELSLEKSTIVKYQHAIKRNLTLLHCSSDSVKGTVIDVIADKIANNPDEKIFIAYNNVGGCFDLAKHLVDHKVMQNEDIRIFCSQANEPAAGPFYSQFEGEELPVQICFFTSAYFTGFDIEKPYHLISVSEGNNQIFALSDKRLKQIAGRCRSKLLSETIIYTSRNGTEIFIPSIEKFIKASQAEIAALNCISLNFDNDELLKQNTKSIRDMIIQNTGSNGAVFVRNNIYDNPTINFLSIDATIDSLKTLRDLYQDDKQLFNALSKEHHAIRRTHLTQVAVTENKAAKDRSPTEKKELIDKLINSGLPELNAKMLNRSELDDFELRIVETCLDFYGILSKDSILMILDTLAGEDMRSYKNMKLAAMFFSSDPQYNNYKNQVLRHIKVGQAYDKTELLTMWGRVFSDSGLGVLFKRLTIGNVTQFTNLHFDTYPTREKPAKVFIRRDNPKNFQLVQYPKHANFASIVNSYFN